MRIKCFLLNFLLCFAYNLDHVEPSSIGASSKINQLQQLNLTESTDSTVRLTSEINDKSGIIKIKQHQRGDFKTKHRRASDLQENEGNHTNACPSNYYNCINSTSCILISHLCNGIINCPFGDDEGKECGSDSCKRSMCKYGCRPSQRGLLCYCPEGFAYKNSFCKEQQIKLPLLLYTSAQHNLIKGITVPLPSSASYSSRIEPLYSPGEVTAVTSDEVEGTIYYCDASNYAVVSQHIHNQTKIAVAHPDSDGCSSLAFDRIAKNIYWTDRKEGSLCVASLLRPGVVRILYQEPNSKPSNLIVHLQLRTMYWIDETSHTILQAFMDGQNISAVMITDAGQPLFLALDPDSYKLFYFDDDDKKIKMFSLKTMEKEVLNPIEIAHAKSLISLVVYNNYLIWVENDMSNIIIFDSKDNKSMALTMEEKIGLVHLIKPESAINLNDSCFSSPCMDLCLPNPQGYRCECRQGYIADADGRCTRSLEHTSCNKDEFHCNNGMCLPQVYVCDGEKDCLDGSDEKACGHQHPCPEGMFKCDQTRCIPESWVCNRHFDCKDFSDEKHCSFNGSCSFPNHSCDNNTKCFSHDRVCDGLVECQDGTDENEECNVPLCNQWGRCSQICHSARKSYMCLCSVGFRLGSDKFTCHSKDSSPPKYLLTTGQSLKLFQLGNVSATVLLSQLSHVVALDYYLNSSHNLIFWSDIKENKIYRGELTERAITNVTSIVSEGISSVEGLAIEWIGHRIYWVDRHYQRIETSAFNGMQRMTLIDNTSQPHSLAVDSRHGLLFWIDWEVTRPRIERAALNGQHRKVIVEVLKLSNGGIPYAITLDYPAKHVYWTDAKTGTLHTIHYDGTNHHVIHYSADITQPYGIGVYEDYIYWTDARHRVFGRVNRWKNNDEKILLVEYPSIYDMKVYHSSRQLLHVTGNSPCINNGNCSHICLIGPNMTSSCHCPYGMTLGRDKKSCIEHETYVLYVTSEGMLFSLEDLISNKWVYPPLKLDISLKMQDVVFAFDPLLKMLYFGKLNVIQRKPISGGPVETVIVFNQRQIMALTIDKKGRNLYILSSSHNSSHKIVPSAFLTVCNINGEFPVDIIWEAADKPISLAVDTQNRILFICHTKFLANTTESFIESAELDGSNRKILVPVENCPKDLVASALRQELCWIEHSMSVACLPYGSNVLKRATIGRASASITAVSNDLNYFFTNESRAYKFDYGIAEAKTFGIVKFAASSEPFDFQENESLLLRCAGKCKALCIPLKSEKICKPITGFHSFLMFLQGGVPHALPLLEDVNMLPQHQRDIISVPLFALAFEDKIELDMYADEVYYSMNDEGIFASRLDGKNQRRVVPLDVPVSAVAIDWIAGNLYWCSLKPALIQVSRLDGRFPYVIVHENLDKPTALALHPAKGLLFWSDSSNSVRIERATLSGSDRKVIVDSSLKEVSDLVVDPIEDVIYWCDPVLGTIEQVHLDGHDRKTILSQNSEMWFSPVSLAVGMKYIYWLDRSHDGSLMTMNKKNSTLISPLKTGLGEEIGAIRLLNEHLPKASNPCSDSNGGCEQLCFFEGLDNYSCACAFSKLATNGRNCADYATFMLLAHKNRLESISLDNPTNLNAPIRPIHPSSSMQNIIDMAFNVESHEIFFSDLIYPPGLFSIYLNGTGLKPVLSDKVVRHVEGMAYDAVHGDLYWSDSATPSICRARVSGRHVAQRGGPEMERIVMLNAEDKPRGIAVDGCNLYVFWTNWQTEHPTIERSFLSGTDHRIIIGDYLVRPNGLTLDSDSTKLYWADAHLDGYQIESADYQGHSRKVISQGFGHHPFDIAVYGNSLYWTDWEVGSLLRTDKIAGRGPLIVRSGLERPKGLAIVSPDRLKCPSREKIDPVQSEEQCNDFCLHGGKCVPSIDSDEKPMCLCSENFAGLRCEIKSKVLTDADGTNTEGSSLDLYIILAMMAGILFVVSILILVIPRGNILPLRHLIFRKESSEREIVRSDAASADGIPSVQSESCEEDYSLINRAFENGINDSTESWLKHGEENNLLAKDIALKTYFCRKKCSSVC